MAANPIMPARESGGMTTPPSPTKKDADKDANKPTFTEREQTLLGVAMAHCLKSGPPEIDFQKFMKHGGFNTLKTAQNTWGKIKGKLSVPNPGADDGEDDEGVQVATKTPNSAKKPQTTTPASKKRGKKAAADDAVVAGPDNEENGSPKKKRRTTPKKLVKKEDSNDDAPAVDDE